MLRLWMQDNNDDADNDDDVGSIAVARAAVEAYEWNYLMANADDAWRWKSVWNDVILKQNIFI